MNSQGGGPCTQPSRLEPSRYKRHERLISALFLYLYSCWTVRYKVQLPPISLLIILKDYQIIYAKNIIIYHMGLTPSTLQTIICYTNTFLSALNQNIWFIVVENPGIYDLQRIFLTCQVNYLTTDQSSNNYDNMMSTIGVPKVWTSKHSSDIELDF